MKSSLIGVVTVVRNPPVLFPSAPVTAGSLPAAYQQIDPYFWGPQEAQINSWFDGAIK